MRTFVALAEELHFGHAARRLNSSQPVVSRTLRDLEDELGARLLERSAPQVRLTRAGTAFLAPAREALRQAETAMRAAQAGTGGGIERLAVGVLIGAALPIVGRLVAAFRDANPAATVDVVAIDERSLGTALTERRIDAAVAWDACVPQGLHIRPIAREHLSVLLPEGHPLTEETAIPPAMLAGYPLLLPDKAGHPILYERFRTTIKDAGVAPDFAINVSDLAQLHAMVAGGAGVGVAPLPSGLTLPSVQTRPLDPDMTVGFDLVWSTLTPPARALVEALSRLDAPPRPAER